jgi:subfamily B ATP-binding cassette protein MsbA
MSSPQKLTPLQVYLRLLSYVKSYWLFFVFSFVGYAIYSGTQAAWVRVIGYLVENVDNPDAQNYIILPLIVLAIFFVRGVGSFMGQYLITVVARSLVHNIRVQVFDKILFLPSKYFSDNNTGHILSRVTFNVEQVTKAATEGIKILLREGTTVIALIGYMLYLSWELTLIFLSVSPLIGLVVSYASQRFRTLGKRIQKSMGNITHAASESIQGHEIVRIFGGEKQESETFYKASNYNRRQSLKLALAQSLNTPVVQMLVAVSLSLLIFLALHPDFLGSVSSVSFIEFITATGLVVKPIRALTNMNSKIQQAIAAASDLFAVLDSDVEKDSGTRTLDKVKGALEFEDVTFRYTAEGEDVLRNLSLLIREGETVAIVGRSGSGKSTLASLVPRFYLPSQGRILLDGNNLEDIDLRSLRKQISLVNQNVFLFQGTLRENIAYGDMKEATEAQIMAACEAAHITEFASKLPNGVDTEIGEKGSKLSGGQRQRIAIARAILKDSPILILDEATSALDNESEKHIKAAMEEVMKGRTTIVIAHRLSTIENADRIVVLDQGVIQEVGNHQELLNKDGAYAQLYKSQFQND